MAEPAPPTAKARRVPRLSLPGGALLFLCLFLPAVRSCGGNVYPIQLPLTYAPYLFGLLAFAMALLPVGRKALVVRAAAWVLSVLAAVGGAWLFVMHLRSNHGSAPKAENLTWLELVLWLPASLTSILSVRHRHDLERWRVRLLLGSGGMSLLFFGFFLFQEHPMFGLWLSIAAAVLLIIEGAASL